MLTAKQSIVFVADVNHQHFGIQIYMYLANTVFRWLFRGPRWACVNLGIFICMQCSGIHRSLGVHISKVLSHFPIHISKALVIIRLIPSGSNLLFNYFLSYFSVSSSIFILNSYFCSSVAENCDLSASNLSAFL